MKSAFTPAEIWARKPAIIRKWMLPEAAGGMGLTHDQAEARFAMMADRHLALTRQKHAPNTSPTHATLVDQRHVSVGPDGEF